MHPLEMTRNAIGNWSDSELNALAAAIKQATEACGARTPSQFTGDDLIAYARLCALGQAMAHRPHRCHPLHHQHRFF